MADPIQIQAPDGSIVEFPAGTSDDVITGAMRKAYPPTQAPSSSDGGGVLQGIREAIHGPTRALENGALLGFGDRARALMDAIIGNGSYSGNLANEQAQTNQYAQAHPVGNFAANLAGGAIVPMGVLGQAEKGATLGAKVLQGAKAGAGFGAVGGAAGSSDLTDLPQTIRDAAFGAGVGGVLGGAVPPLASGVGKGFNWLASALQSTPGIPKAAVPHLVEALRADGIPGVQRALTQYGPDAMLADTGPAMLGKLQGASLNSDEARSIAQGNLTQRNLGTNARIQSDVNGALGPAEDPQTVSNAILAHRQAVDNVAYPAALDNAPAVDTAPIVRQLDAMIPKSVGNERKALENLRGMMTKPAAPTEPAAPAGVGNPAPSNVAADVEAIRAKYGDAAAAAYQKQNQPPQAQSLLEFLASKGGLGPDAELDALGAQSHVVNVDGLGRRKLVRQGGLPLDYAREAAEEAGYLSGGHNGTSGVNDLLDAIDAEMRGQKRYPAGQEGTQTRREMAARSEREQAEYDRHVQGMEDDLAAAGHGQLGPDVKARAVNLMANQGMDADTAVEHALGQLEQEDNAARGAFPGDRPAVAPSAAAPTRLPQTDASVLHKVKQELDNVIQYDQPGLGVPAGALTRQQGTLKLFRGQLNNALERQVPGYKEANATSAALAKRAEAVQSGTQYLGNGKTTPSPERFAAEFEPLSQGEKIAFAKGSRGNIDRVLGTKANDLQALRSELQGEGGWNTAKLAAVHGDQAANDLINSVDRNLKFRDTYNKVVEGSQTAQRAAAAKAMKPEPASETPLINPNMSLTGLAGTTAKKATAAVFNALLKRDPTAAYGDVARILSAQGPQAQAHLDALARILAQRNANSAVANRVGNLGALPPWLAANYLRDRLTAPQDRK